MVQLEPLSDGERKEWLDRLTDNIQRQSLNSATIEKELVERAIQVLDLVYYSWFSQHKSGRH